MPRGGDENFEGKNKTYVSLIVCFNQPLRDADSSLGVGHKLVPPPWRELVVSRNPIPTLVQTRTTCLGLISDLICPGSPENIPRALARGSSTNVPRTPATDPPTYARCAHWVQETLLAADLENGVRALHKQNGAASRAELPRQPLEAAPTASPPRPVVVDAPVFVPCPQHGHNWRRGPKSAPSPGRHA